MSTSRCGRLRLVASISIFRGARLGEGPESLIAYQLLHESSESVVKVRSTVIDRFHCVRHEISVTIVFDGATLPMKEGTEVGRARARSVALHKALQHEERGEKTLAHSCFARAVDVTPQIAFEVSEELKKCGVKVIVAPYEADAQLGYLSRNGHVDIVISEDSDLLVFGCKRVLYKLDFKTERGKEIFAEDIFKVSGFSRLSRESFLLTSILAGCDYVPSLASIGMKTAISLGAKAEAILTVPDMRMDSDKFLDKLLILIGLAGVDGSSFTATEFKEQVRRAMLTFCHQTVFCPTRRKLVPLIELSEQLEDLSFLGSTYDAETACGVADCLLHPETKNPFTWSAIPVGELENEPRTSSGPVKRPRTGATSEKVLTTKNRLVDLWNAAAKPKSVVQDIVDLDPEQAATEDRPDEFLRSIENHKRSDALDPRRSKSVITLDSIDSLRFTQKR